MSDDMKELYAALTKAQAAMGKAQKNAKNPHFRSSYADLASVMDACLPALHDNGFCVMQPTGEDDTGRYVETVLAHTSGASVSCRTPLILSKPDMQQLGSAITYARRYGLMTMAGIAPEDDDGNAAAKAPQTQQRREPSQPAFDAASEGRRLMDAISTAQDAGSLDALLAAEAGTLAKFNAAGRGKLMETADARRGELSVDDSIPY